MPSVLEGWFLQAVFHWCQARMLLEVAGEEGLVGEPQFEGDFLHGLVRRAEQHLDFLDATGVDVLFGRVSRQVLDDGGEVARGDAELVGIELHVAMGAAMLEDKGDELLQEFLLPGRIGGIAVEELRLCLVVNVHQEVLQTVLEDLYPESMLSFHIYMVDEFHHPAVPFHLLFGQMQRKGVLFQEGKERRVEVGRYLQEDVADESNVGDRKVRTRLQTLEV